MPRKKVASNSSLGSQLMKQKKKQPYKVGEGPDGRGFKVHTTIESRDNRPQLSSILDQNSLEEYMQLTELSKKKFEAERDVQYISSSEVVPTNYNGYTNMSAFVNNFIEGTAASQKDIQRGGHYQDLKIPRRPTWDKNMTAHEITQRENLAFLEWRRDIASQEQNAVNLAITPFEKNIEVWKQLWRVIEKSDVLMQIVDARNPDFFYASDLEKYITDVGEGKKEFMLLINKSDFLSEGLIKHWNDYFNEKGVKHLFFSALKEQNKIDNVDQDADSDQANSDQESESSDEELQDPLEQIKIEDAVMDTVKENIFSREFIEKDAIEKLEQEQKIKDEAQALQDKGRIERQELGFNTTHIFNRGELLAILKHYSVQMNKQREAQHKDRLMVGTVGYPNVGKSSVINVLCGIKRVGVANRPGKTKHFQTLNLDEDLCLCDCPGLVFPSFANSKAEMMTCGVLNIDTMRDYVAPIQLVMSRVPKEVLEAQYKVKLPPRESSNYTASVFLQLIAGSHGWLNGAGVPNEAVAARHVLKDYTNGKLLYCQLRPDYDPQKHGEVSQSGFNIEMKPVEDVPNARAYQPLDSVSEEEDDGEEEKSTLTASSAFISTKSKQVEGMLLNEADAFDRQFFQKETKLKLNKAEKRQLKFALKNGADLSQVEDLQGFLQNAVANVKTTQFTPHLPGVGVGGKPLKPGQRPQKPGIRKVSDYKDLQSNYNI